VIGAAVSEARRQLAALEASAQRAEDGFLHALSERERRTLTALLHQVLRADDHARLDRRT
jgi:hypothetical protein